MALIRAFGREPFLEKDNTNSQTGLAVTGRTGPLWLWAGKWGQASGGSGEWKRRERELTL